LRDSRLALRHNAPVKTNVLPELFEGFAMRAAVGSLDRRRFLSASVASLTVLSSALEKTYADEIVPLPGIEKRLDQLAHDAPLKLRFQGSTAEECRAWQKEFGSKLRELLGAIDPPTRWETVTERVVDCQDHVRHELVLQAEGIASVPMHLLLPKGHSGQRPGVLALHGHGPFGHEPVSGLDDRPELRRNIETANYDYGRQLVRLGYVVAVPCLTPFGRRRADGGENDICGVTATRLQFLGRLLIGENLRDARWAMNAMLERAPVDAGRIGCVGLSYGGRMTTLVAAVDSRVRIAVVSGALNCFQERISTTYGAGCQLIPGILEYGDIPEIASLIAPRTLVFETGSRDSLIKPEWVGIAWQRMSKAYNALVVKERLLLDRFEGGHRWNGTLAVEMLARELTP
jgi:dienelactone hydrolase